MGLSNTLGILRSLYPQARVTSGLRNPNSALGRANPHSYHNVGQAFDVAPIPGVAFGDYVNRLKGSGVNVVEALDEASHPKPWTTGPNWHIAFGDAPQMAATNPLRRNPRTLQDIASSGWSPSATYQDQVTMDAQPLQPQAQSLGDLVQNMPQGNIKGPSKFNFGNIAGILGDALMAYGGLKPEFGPALQRQNELQQTQGFDREKLNAEVNLRREEALLKAQEPPQFVQNAQAWAGLTPDQKRAVLQEQDAVNPINVSTPMGTQNVPRTAVKTIGGKTYYSIGGEWYEGTE